MNSDRYGVIRDCKNQFCSNPKRKHFQNAHCDYDVMGVCECGIQILYHTWEYQEHRVKMHGVTGNKISFAPKCHTCFKNTLLTVPKVV